MNLHDLFIDFIIIIILIMRCKVIKIIKKKNDNYEVYLICL